MIRRFCAVLLLLTLAACAGTGTRDVEAIQNVVTAAGPNSVLVSRKTGLTGVVYRINIDLDGERVGSLANDEVITFEVPKGQHTLEAQFEGPASIGVKKGRVIFTNDGTSADYFTLSIQVNLFSTHMKLFKVTGESFLSTTR